MEFLIKIFTLHKIENTTKTKLHFENISTSQPCRTCFAPKINDLQLPSFDWMTVYGLIEWLIQIKENASFINRKSRCWWCRTEAEARPQRDVGLKRARVIFLLKSDWKNENVAQSEFSWPFFFLNFRLTWSSNWKGATSTLPSAYGLLNLEEKNDECWPRRVSDSSCEQRRTTCQITIDIL